MKISELLHKAADEHLAHDSASWAFDGKAEFSCHAVWHACSPPYTEMYEQILKGLKEMGCPVNSSYAPSLWEMNSYEVTEQTQGARYMWLKFAALMAEEQGV